MTTPTVDAFGRPATGIQPLTDCPDWCHDRGHVGETHTDDQVCRSESVYVEPSLAAKYPSSSDGVIAATAHREFGEDTVVQIHVTGFHPYIDSEIHLTADEARTLAAQLTHAATLIEH